MDGMDSQSMSCMNSDMLSRKRPAWNGFFSLKLVLFEDFIAIWYDDKSSLESEHEMSLSTDVPVYKLYGEHDQWLTPDMVHCESIAARSQLHNWQIKPHQHHGLFQILYLKKGTAKVRLDDRHQDMRAGQILMVPQMCIHGFRFARNAEGHVITLAYPLIGKISRDIGDGMITSTSPHIHCLGDDVESDYIKTAFSAVDHEYKRNAPHRNLLLESLLGAILIWLTRNSANSSGQQSKAVSRGLEHFAHFCDLIEECYTRHYPVAHYARKIGITAAHLNVLCRQAVGQSALDLIHERMLLEARRNLVYTSMTVSVVSYTLGFSDPAYFTRFFKRRVGLSPKDFRRQATAIFEHEKQAERITNRLER
jgi:AraC family transcriptional activator of pobA